MVYVPANVVCIVPSEAASIAGRPLQVSAVYGRKQYIDLERVQTDLLWITTRKWHEGCYAVAALAPVKCLD